MNNSLKTKNGRRVQLRLAPKPWYVRPPVVTAGIVLLALVVVMGAINFANQTELPTMQEQPPIPIQIEPAAKPQPTISIPGFDFGTSIGVNNAGANPLELSPVLQIAPEVKTIPTVLGKIQGPELEGALGQKFAEYREALFTGVTLPAGATLYDITTRTIVGTHNLGDSYEVIKVNPDFYDNVLIQGRGEFLFYNQKRQTLTQTAAWLLNAATIPPGAETQDIEKAQLAEGLLKDYLLGLESSARMDMTPSSTDWVATVVAGLAQFGTFDYGQPAQAAADQLWTDFLVARESAQAQERQRQEHAMATLTAQILPPLEEQPAADPVMAPELSLMPDPNATAGEEASAVKDPANNAEPEPQAQPAPEQKPAPNPVDEPIDITTLVTEEEVEKVIPLQAVANNFSLFGWSSVPIEYTWRWLWGMRTVWPDFSTSGTWTVLQVVKTAEKEIAPGFKLGWYNVWYGQTGDTVANIDPTLPLREDVGYGIDSNGMRWWIGPGFWFNSPKLTKGQVVDIKDIAGIMLDIYGKVKK